MDPKHFVYEHLRKISSMIRDLEATESIRTDEHQVQVVIGSKKGNQFKGKGKTKESTVAQLSALGPDHTVTVLFLGTHMRTSQWVTRPRNALTQTRLTSEFLWNSKPVSSQKPSC
ncbi:hypothetical protein ACFX14_000001 [Malus domestica]